MMMNYDDHIHTLKSLLADTLCVNADSDMIVEIFNRSGSVSGLLNVTEEELHSIKGIGKARARQITSAFKLARLMNVPIQSPYIIRTPSDVARLMKPEIGHLQQEHFVVLFLNTKNHLINKKVVFIGSLNACVVHPREIFNTAIRQSSASIVLVHNHPSGDSHPSREDIDITKRLIESGEIIGIDVLDHVIISRDKFFSLKEQGLL